jgi:hypothetical protein
VQLREREQEIKRRPAAVARSGWAIILLSGGPIKAKMCVAGHTQTHQHTATCVYRGRQLAQFKWLSCAARLWKRLLHANKSNRRGQQVAPAAADWSLCGLLELLWASRTIKCARPAGHLVGQTLGRVTNHSTISHAAGHRDRFAIVQRYAKANANACTAQNSLVHGS